jgi:hypothetical protein
MGGGGLKLSLSFVSVVPKDQMEITRSPHPEIDPEKIKRNSVVQTKQRLKFPGKNITQKLMRLHAGNHAFSSSHPIPPSLHYIQSFKNFNYLISTTILGIPREPALHRCPYASLLSFPFLLYIYLI